MPAVLLAWLGLLAVVALTLATALFVAAEFSLVAADRSELEGAARSGDRAAARALAAVRTLSFQLSGAQLGITITTLAVGFLAEPALTELLHPLLGWLPDRATDVVGVVLALLIATLLQMVFGELVPKNWAIARPTHVARLVAGPMWAFTRAFKWVIAACNHAANAIVRGFGLEPQEELRAARSPEELGSLVQSSLAGGSLPGATANLLTRSLGFSDLTAGEVMTPRTRVVTLPADATVDDLLAIARRTGLSRFPVLEPVDGSGVRVVQVKRAFSVAPADRGATAVTALAQPLPEVPESLPVHALLAQLRQPGSQMAIVIDEWGGVAGIVTLEDVLEELVGSVVDEHDQPSSDDFEQPDGTFVLPGLLRVHEVDEVTGFTAPEGPYDTLGGLIMSELGRVPVPGDSVDVGGWTIRVEALDGLRVESARLTPPADRPAEDA